MSERENSNRGPNGFPYVDPERSEIGYWENGDYRLRISRKDGEVMNTNLTPKQMRALLNALLHTLSEDDSDEIVSVNSGSKVEGYEGEPEHTLRVNDVSGFPGTIVGDLERADGQQPERVSMAHWYHKEEDQSVVVIQALDDDALDWLYNWLVETCQYYREEYVDASGEYDAANELADAVYEVADS